MIDFDVIRTKHNGREPEGFSLIRQHGVGEYLFLHFKTPAKMTLSGKTHSLIPGTCIILTPGTPHELYTDGCDLVHDWMHFFPTDEAVFSKLKIEINAFFTLTENDFITSMIKHCEDELIFKDDYYRELISAEVSRMMINIARFSCGNGNHRYGNVMRKLRIDIYRHPSHYYSVEDMYKNLGLSRSRFTVLYKEIFGVSPKSDLISARVSKATYLLSLGNHTLTEVSEMSGWSNVYHFIRQFKAEVGTTPAAYMKSINI